MGINYMIRYINSLYSIGTRKNCYKNGKKPLLFQFIRKAIKVTNNYRGISLLSTYKILSNILLTRMAPYTNEIIQEYQCGFKRNRSTTYLSFGN
jgi:hypothetical protein